ncbi:MAG: prolipoprotein diacylglyceryl transferase [Ruminococcus sp.]|nr:prolipoprotein diacylglyceryl transferase [Ruminococcus sp.]
MLPIIRVFGLGLSTYGICTAVGLLLMGVVALILGRRYGIKPEDIVFGEIIALVGAFFGAHILFGLTNLGDIIHYLQRYIDGNKDFGYLIRIFQVYVGGMVFYGGLLGALGFGTLYCRVRKINTESFSDCFAVGIPLFHCFGRLGCFLSGCCYGIESDVGFTATHAIVKSCNYVNRFPVQLLESALNLIIFSVLLVLFRKRILTCKLIYAYLIMYSVLRFFDEFLRGDVYRGIYFGLSTSQWISIVLFVISLILILKKNNYVCDSKNIIPNQNYNAAL